MRRAAAGPQLAAGRIRVDAARAIAKLREYQLADRAAWVLEGIRAAVAARATRIDLRGDANDIWLTWEGEPWPSELLPRLFDELVSPEPVSERHHVRLLAAAVNSALGLRPAHVDVIAVGRADASRVRYTPEILAEPETELGESALRHVDVESVPAPDGMQPGMRVHLRRRFVDWKLFGEPRELELARETCRDIAVPVHVGGLVLHRDTSADIVRLPLGDGVDGFIAVTEMDRATPSAMIEVAERGVVLAEYGLDLLHDVGGGPLPIRVFVDAPRMPTNASRSQVRREAHPIATAERRAQKLVPELITQLAEAVKQGSERARTSALGLIAARVRGSRWHVDVPAIGEPLRVLAQLPLVRNAVGEPRSLAAHWRAEVHTGKHSFDPALAPWLDDVLWAPPGDPATQLVNPVLIDTRGTRRLARWARRQLRARNRFLDHAKRAARVQTTIVPRIRVQLAEPVEGSAIPQDWFTALAGEVCLYADGDSGALAVLLDGRELERIEFDSPLAFDVVIDSALVSPGDRYRGVKRDATYTRVERAMRAGIVRALEAHVLEQKKPGSGIDIDARLSRKGLGVLHELDLEVRGPLADAPAYRTVDGRWVSHRDLASAPAIGVASPGATVLVPEGRIVLELDAPERAVLAQQLDARLVSYRRQQREDLNPVILRAAAAVGGVLVLKERGMTAAISPSSHAQLRLYHIGVELETCTYMSHWLPCNILIDSDALIPDEQWSSAVGRDALIRRDYADWELALLRAIARALVGEPTPDLVVAEPPTIDNRLGRVLCRALLQHDPGELLGMELVAKLRSAALLRVLGESEQCSIDELAARFPARIPYIIDSNEPVPGFSPLIASTLVAETVAKLAGREHEDATNELLAHLRRASRERRVAEHRQLAQQPMAVPSQHHVSVQGELAHGVVGLWPGMFEIRVFVEGRPFTVLHPPAALPLVAALEIGLQYCNETFDGIRDHRVERQLTDEVRAAVPELLLHVTKQAPDSLGDETPARRLLAEADLPANVREVLVGAPVFHTIQGGRIAIARAAHPRLILSIAAWRDEWLGPTDDESPDALDAPIVFVPDPQHELSRIVEKLHGGAIVDVSEDVARLQSRRRMARGLLPQPRVRGVAPAFKQPLSAFGELGKRLGLGEIALLEDATSLLMLHSNGHPVRIEPLDVLPPIALAIEMAEQGEIERTAQQLAVALVKHVLATEATLSSRLQRNLLRAALGKRIDGRSLAELPLFYPYGDGAPSWQTFVRQLAQHGDVWAVQTPTEQQPLDETRHVFVMQDGDLGFARDHGWAVVDATKELALDQLARRHLARSRPRSLELPAREAVLAEVTLDGDGRTAPRGTVGVLTPAASRSRGAWTHREMHPFDQIPDPCRWPTLSVIDDARLTPDRTWSAPVVDEHLQAVAKQLRAASERALATLGAAPVDALIELRINNHACADVAALRKAPKSLIRGVLWLVREPRQSVKIQVVDQNGAWPFVPDEQLSLGGKLFVFSPDGLHVKLALSQLCGQTHRKLVRALMKREDVGEDIRAAHVAHALFVRTLKPTETRAVQFTCFAPRALDARALHSLLRRDEPVTVIRPDMPPNPDPDVVELIDDGSELARVLILALDGRVRRARPAPRPRRTDPAAAPTTAEPRPGSVPNPMPEREREAAHPLHALVALLRKRLAELGISGHEWTIVDRAEPMFRYDTGTIEVAGDNTRLHALAAAVAAKSSFAAAGIDVIAAHVVTVLNVALSHITDGTEAHALGVLLTSQPSADRRRSRRSS